MFFAEQLYTLKTIILFQNSVQYLYYPDIQKRSNIIPVHKKVINNQVITIDPFLFYESLKKKFEKIIFNKIYNFLLDERLLNPNQPGFCSSDTCVNQLLAIAHVIFEAFNCNLPLEVRSVFLDISRAFDKVLHESLLFYKLQSMRISGEL